VVVCSYIAGFASPQKVGSPRVSDVVAKHKDLGRDSGATFPNRNQRRCPPTSTRTLAGELDEEGSSCLDPPRD